MAEPTFLLTVFIIAVALAFDYINGFHDAANSIATVVSTRVLTPLQGVAWAAFWNFIAAFTFGTAVAKTVGSGLLDVNLIAAVNVAHAFASEMAKRGCGSLLFLTSVAGQIGSPTDPPYSAAKAGLINFMQVVARDLAPHGVRANALAPGMVKTDLNESVWAAGQRLLPEDRRQSYAAWAEEKIRKLAPLGRWQQPDEFAAMAVFLASDHARNITGQTLNIDGGQVMHA